MLDKGVDGVDELVGGVPVEVAGEKDGGVVAGVRDGDVGHGGWVPVGGERFGQGDSGPPSRPTAADRTSSHRAVVGPDPPLEVPNPPRGGSQSGWWDNPSRIHSEHGYACRIGVKGHRSTNSGHSAGDDPRAATRLWPQGRHAGPDPFANSIGALGPIDEDNRRTSARTCETFPHAGSALLSD